MGKRRTEFGPSIYEDCGTYKAFQRHKIRDTLVCQPCTDANAKYHRDRRHRIGESSGTWLYIPDQIELTDDHYTI